MNRVVNLVQLLWLYLHFLFSTMVFHLHFVVFRELVGAVT